MKVRRFLFYLMAVCLFYLRFGHLDVEGSFRDNAISILALMLIVSMFTIHSIEEKVDDILEEMKRNKEKEKDE